MKLHVGAVSYQFYVRSAVEREDTCRNQGWLLKKFGFPKIDLKSATVNVYSRRGRRL